MFLDIYVINIVKNVFNKSIKVTTTRSATETEQGHSNNKCFNDGGNRHSMRECPAREESATTAFALVTSLKLCLSKNKNVNTIDTTYDQDFVMTVNIYIHPLSYKCFGQKTCQLALVIITDNIV